MDENKNMLRIRMMGGFVKFFREVMADGRCRGIPANIWLNINKSNPFLPSVSPSSGLGSSFMRMMRRRMIRIIMNVMRMKAYFLISDFPSTVTAR